MTVNPVNDNLGSKFVHAGRGLLSALHSEISLQIEAAVAAAVLMAAVLLDISRADWLWLVAAITLVFICEILNTAIEQLVDLVSPGFSPAAGKIKDLCAGAVLIAALASVAIGLIVFLPYLF